jgi:hypothetical protein
MSGPITLVQLRAAAEAYHRATGDADEGRISPWRVDDLYRVAAHMAISLGLDKPPPPEVQREKGWAIMKRDFDLWWAEVERAQHATVAQGHHQPAGESEVKNTLRLSGNVWHVRYGDGDEAGDFKDQTNSVFRHLARLLAEPNRRFGASAFYPPPPGRSPCSGAPALPRYGRDASSDDQAMKEYEAEMRRLVQELKEAEEAGDTEEAARLRNKFKALAPLLQR